MVAAQEAQAQAVLQQARVSRAGVDLGRGVWGEREDSRRGWKHWSEYHTGKCLGWFGAEREVRENTGQWNKNQEWKGKYGGCTGAGSSPVASSKLCCVPCYPGQLALRGPPGPMGYTGRPGPLVSEWGIGVGDSLFVCGRMDSSGKELNKSYIAALERALR